MKNEIQNRKERLLFLILVTISTFVYSQVDNNGGESSQAYNFNLIELECSDDWEVFYHEIEDNKVYIAECKQKKSGNFITIIISNHNPELISWMKGLIGDLATAKQSEFSSIYEGKYLRYNAMFSDFVNEDELFYGRMISLKTTERAFLIIEQANTKCELNYEFRPIENSLRFK